MTDFGSPIKSFDAGAVNFSTIDRVIKVSHFEML